MSMYTKCTLSYLSYTPPIPNRITFTVDFGHTKISTLLHPLGYYHYKTISISKAKLDYSPSWTLRHLLKWKASCVHSKYKIVLAFAMPVAMEWWIIGEAIKCETILKLKPHTFPCSIGTYPESNVCRRTAAHCKHTTTTTTTTNKTSQQV